MMRGKQTGDQRPRGLSSRYGLATTVRHFHRRSIRVFLRTGVRSRLHSRPYPEESSSAIPAGSRRETVAANQGKFAHKLYSRALYDPTGSRHVHTLHLDEHGIAEWVELPQAIPAESSFKHRRLVIHSGAARVNNAGKQPSTPRNAA